MFQFLSLFYPTGFKTGFALAGRKSSRMDFTPFIHNKLSTFGRANPDFLVKLFCAILNKKGGEISRKDLYVSGLKYCLFSVC